MKRIYVRLVLGLIISLFFVGVVPRNASADVNNFNFSSFDADYYLSKDKSGHSTLKVVERLTAEFVNKNQNRGIERAVPRFYDGHTVSFQFESMKRNGVIEPLYQQRQESQFIVLSTRRNDFVNGTQVYTFTYTLRDVIKTFGNHQELYWDTNGTGWRQSFGSLTVRVHLDDSIKPAFNGDVSCYKGQAGSNDKCTGSIDGNVISFSSGGPLLGGENLTYVLSFKAGTFVGYQQTLSDFLPYALIVLAVLLFIVAVIFKIRYGRNYPGRGMIVPEYLPPKDTSVLLAAEISGIVPKSSTAQILDLAVRHKIKIIESEHKILFTKNIKYTMEIVNVDGLDMNELEFINIFFKGHEIGSQYSFEKNDTTRGRFIYILNNTVKEETEQWGFRQKQPRKKAAQWLIIGILYGLIIIAGFVFINNMNNAGIFVSCIVFFILVALTFIFKIYSLRPLTAKGRELFDYLKGLEVYIKLAEADRIKILQSPEGAQKKPIDTSDSAKMIVLYERVLPYAVLFGQEKEWLKQLGTYYENSQVTPGWYSGMSTFNAAAFASSIGSFSSYANSSSFSSSSGAGGGGSSGGGGGGGGGGGV